MTAFELHPVDTLFFRDARPMQAGAGSGGHGANWPLPNTLHEALRAHLLREAGVPLNERKRHTKTNDAGQQRSRDVVSDAFRSLRTIGPLPTRDGALYVPMPSDLVPADDRRLNRLQPSPGRGAANFPSAGLRPVLAPCPPVKAALPEWVRLDWFRTYLGGDSPLPSPGGEQTLYESEPRIGVEIDPTTRAARDHKLYASEHLRLKDGTGLWFQASLSERDSEHNRGATLDTAGCPCLTLGGEGRLARLAPAHTLGLDDLPEPEGLRIAWVLITPAVFLHGWRPDWIGEDRSVMLRTGDTDRIDGEDRKTWRRRIRSLPPIGAHLVAARIAKPIAYSGWDLADGGPKPTFLAVPAGTVYYFEADSSDSAAALVKALHLRTRSDRFGEKGMGFGVCGAWQEGR